MEQQHLYMCTPEHLVSVGIVCTVFATMILYVIGNVKLPSSSFDVGQNLYERQERER